MRRILIRASKPTTAQRCRSATEKKNILEDLLSSVLSQFEKYHPSGNLEFHYLDISQSLKLHILKGKILSISLKLNFTPNTLGGYGLTDVCPRYLNLGESTIIFGYISQNTCFVDDFSI